MTFKRSINGFAETIFRIFMLISTFTAVDIIYHYLYETNYGLYAVPMSYYLNKLIVGTILGIVAYIILNNMLKWTKYSYKKISIFSLIIVIPLQIKYFMSGHFTLFQNITIVLAHYAFLLAILTIYYKIYDMDYLG